MTPSRIRSSYVGRFAPSPTGDLHFGSLLAAVASYLQSKTSGGKWLVRIEDIDPPREIAGSATRILNDLTRLLLIPDAPVLRQSQRTESYQDACNQLLHSNLAYWCGCSRRNLPASGVYPGTCRSGISNGGRPRALRLKVEGMPIRFADLVQGQQTEDLQHSCGDFVIRRADGLFAYQLAVVVDDAYQNVTEVVRGADLLNSTARQIWLQMCLGLNTPAYAHIPMALQFDGQKLSKRLHSDAIRSQKPAEALRLALAFLGHEAPKLDLNATWAWAVEHWSLGRVPTQHAQPAPDCVP